jgi:hypothetical protein
MKKLVLLAAAVGVLSVTLTGCAFQRSGPVAEEPTPSASPSVSSSPVASPSVKPSTSPSISPVPSVSPSETVSPTPQVSKTPSKPSNSGSSAALSDLKNLFSVSQAKAFSTGFVSNHILTLHANKSNASVTNDFAVYDVKQNKGFTSDPINGVVTDFTSINPNSLTGFMGKQNFKVSSVLNMITSDSKASIVKSNGQYTVKLSSGVNIMIQLANGVISSVMVDKSKTSADTVEAYGITYAVDATFASLVKNAPVN